MRLPALILVAVTGFALSPLGCSTGSVSDLKILSEECPRPSPPSRGFCEGGEIKTKQNTHGCTLGYECLDTESSLVTPPREKRTGSKT
jgi:hypothetical protein